MRACTHTTHTHTHAHATPAPVEQTTTRPKPRPADSPQDVVEVGLLEARLLGALRAALLEFRDDEVLHDCFFLGALFNVVVMYIIGCYGVDAIGVGVDMIWGCVVVGIGLNVVF